MWMEKAPIKENRRLIRLGRRDRKIGGTNHQTRFITFNTAGILVLTCVWLLLTAGCVTGEVRTSAGTNPDNPANTAGDPAVSNQSGTQAAPIPGEQVLEGFVQMRKENPGTLSEYRYYVLSKRSGSDPGGVLLFQESSGKSRGFEDYIGRRVRLNGRWGQGSIDFRNTMMRGFLVRTLEIIE